MSEFKFVQWGKGVPVDYQRLNAMMLNEQYLKDTIDASPRGILAKAASTTDYTTSSVALTYTDLTNMGSIPFTVEDNRIVKITINGNYVDNPDTTNDYVTTLAIYLDGSGTSTFSTQCYNAIQKRATFPTLIYVTSTPLAAGNHTLKVQAAMYSSDSTPTGQVIKAPFNCIIEDIGAAI